MSVKPSLPVRPARSELLAPPEASCSPRPKRVVRPARSELLAPLEASCSPRPKRVVRPARSELLAPLEACYSPRSERVVRPPRSELLAPLEASCSPRSKRVTRPAPELPLHTERGVPPNPERDGTSAPSETVPLIYLSMGGGRRTGNVYIVLLTVCFCKDSCRSL